MTLTPLDRQQRRRALGRSATRVAEIRPLVAEVEERLFERLEHFALQPGRLLELSGPGGPCPALAGRFPDAVRIRCGPSPMLLRRGAPRGAPADPVLCADPERLPLATRSVDVVFSPAAVPLSDDEPGLFAEIRRVLRPGGWFLFASLGPDTLRELRDAWAAADERLRVYRFADMHDVGDALVRAGFRDPVMDVERLRLEYGAPADLLRELRSLGVTSVARDRPRGLTGRRRFETMLAALRPADAENCLRVSCELVFGAARAPGEGQPVRTPEGEVATFSVESLKRRR
ncbi:MAG: methyltransferase domain-containing protein [Gammaproteobacteria bacterium]